MARTGKDRTRMSIMIRTGSRVTIRDTTRGIVVSEIRQYSLDTPSVIVISIIIVIISSYRLARQDEQSITSLLLSYFLLRFLDPPRFSRSAAVFILLHPILIGSHSLVTLTTTRSGICKNRVSVLVFSLGPHPCFSFGSAPPMQRNATQRPMSSQICIQASSSSSYNHRPSFISL
jgi:hypothetical protein